MLNLLEEPNIQKKFNIFELDNEFDNTEFSRAGDKTLVRVDLAGAGKTTNIIMYYQSIDKKILVVCPTNALALDIQTKFKNVVAITFCRFVGIIVGVEKKEDKKTRTYDLEEFDVVIN